MSDLLKYVKAAAKWYTFGSHLGLKHNKLEVIRKDSFKDSSAALMAVFRVWLDNAQDPSWSVIVRALNDTELGVLASEIDAKFCV